MLIILFFLFGDGGQAPYVRSLCSYERGNRELYYVYVYLVGTFFSYMTPPSRNSYQFKTQMTVLFIIKTCTLNCQPPSNYCFQFPYFFICFKGQTNIGYLLPVILYHHNIAGCISLPVDKISTFFLPFTQDIDSFFTSYIPVDNFYAHNATVVDKLRKTIARLAII